MPKRSVRTRVIAIVCRAVSSRKKKRPRDRRHRQLGWMTVRTRLAALNGNGILGDVLRLVSGTAGGRLIALLAMPIVTRLYSPDDFALLAVYLSLVSMGGVIACLRFDVAIPVAENEADAAHLLVLALTIAATIAAVLMIVAVTIPDLAAQALSKPALAHWLWLVPVGIFLAASYSALQFWATRLRRFGTIAVTRITQAATGVGAMLALGWAGFAPLGLLLGNMLNNGAGNTRLLVETSRRDRAVLVGVSRSGLLSVFGKYRRFPLYSVPEALANIAGLQIPILMIAGLAGNEAGYLLLAQQVMTAPMALLGSSIAQVYVSRAPEALKEGRLAEFTLSMLGRLAQIGVAPLIVAGIVAPFVFPLVFGPEWQRSGEIISWMVPWMVLQFLATPISLALHVTRRQHWAMALHVAGLLLRVLPLLVALRLSNGYLVAGYIAGSTLFYAMYLIVVIYSAGISLRANIGRAIFGLLFGLSAYSLLIYSLHHGF
ncbi:lipopolysaccharide biosynthesis protein [Tianweitania sp. BSSL-BM11]|uniref:Lipopolysaccharide biosynthesis protein n=1 Tax=Tianweitania aestuarii TaxID=2814886 RepID=A0ABS5RTN9_9HYPH|nr:lipopolysaccharide biosynthesis protein [Tianweitania aestuarii]MBS9719641.1 lipopolysaccharide biosynthesis protein [Tianweitania aestuarii]